MKPLRLGLVGGGPWGRNYIRTIAGMKEVRLARTAGRADWRELVRAGDVDAVVVAVPPAAQPEIALAAIEAGRPLLLEKPLALSDEAAQRILAAAAARAVPVIVDHIHLFHPDWEALKRAAAQEPVRAIRAAAGSLGPYRPNVGTLWDWGPHDVAMCLDLMAEEPARVDAVLLESKPAGAGFAERLRIELGFAGGALARIEIDTLREKHRRFEVELGSRTLVYDAPQPADEAQMPLARAVRAFAAAVAAGSASLDSLRLGAAVVRVLARCERRLAQSGGRPT